MADDGDRDADVEAWVADARRAADPERGPGSSPITHRAALAALDWLGAEAAGAVALGAIWATVDLERALRDLGLESGRAASAVEDPLLGARVVRVAGLGAEAGETPVALAEPSTEGRLAAFLARNGEGAAGRYVGVPLAIGEITARAAAAGVSISRPVPGPFGREVLVLDGRRGAAHVILVEVAAVPSRP